MAAAGQNPPRKGATVKGAAMKPKIYISHPDATIEEIAERVGVTKRRMKELIALAAEINGSKPPHPSTSNGKASARKHAPQAPHR
jgi:hypothetical protein